MYDCLSCKLLCAVIPFDGLASFKSRFFSSVQIQYFGNIIHDATVWK